MRRLVTIAAACTMLGACAIGYPSPVVIAPGGYHGSPVQIPAGHMPPPGECRIWYPDRPAGHQPPPFPCDASRFRVPAAGYLIRG